MRPRDRHPCREDASHRCMGVVSVVWLIEESIVISILGAHMATRYVHTHSKDKVRTCVCRCESREE